MEHANKAMIMAFGMLVAVMIMGTIAFVFTRLKAFPTQDDEIESVEQRRLFNQEYEVYDKRIMYGVDVISVLNKAQSNNEKYVEGNFLSGNLYNTDYIINIVVTLTRDVEEKFEVTYLQNDPTGVNEIEYVGDKGPSNPSTVSARTVFTAPKSDYQLLVYGDSSRWNSLDLKAGVIDTAVSPGKYQLLGGGTISEPDSDGITHYTNAMIDGDSVLKQMLKHSTTMSQTVRNTGSNRYGYETGWNRATWYPAIYDFKTKKFKCEGDKVTYSPRTGRIVYMEFTEV